MLDVRFREQVGARGAQTAANLVAPDLTIILDTNRAWDYQEDAGDVQGRTLKKGVLLTYYDPSVLPNRFADGRIEKNLWKRQHCHIILFSVRRLRRCLVQQITDGMYSLIYEHACKEV